MKILITGAKGVVGSFLAEKLKDHDVFVLGRETVDISNRKQVDEFFNNHKEPFDVVLHCAIVGANRIREMDWNILDNNLKMYYNILDNKAKYKRLISFGSGAEIFLSHTPYGLSKKVISQSILGQDNAYNIVIFGLFGEKEKRFVYTILNSYANKQDIEIYEKKFMDFFYMEDLWSVVKYYLYAKNPPKYVDCSYTNSKRTLHDIAEYINTLDDHRVDIKLKFNKS